MKNKLEKVLQENAQGGFSKRKNKICSTTRNRIH